MNSKDSPVGEFAIHLQQTLDKTYENLLPVLRSAQITLSNQSYNDLVNAALKFSREFDSYKISIPVDNLSHINAIIKQIDIHSLQRAAEAATESAETIRIIQESVAIQLGDTVRAMQQLSTWVAKESAAIRTTFRQFVNSDLFRELFEKIQISEDEEKAFKAAKWPIAPSMSKELRARVVQMHKEGKTRYISRSILAFYERHEFGNLERAVEKWNNYSLFLPRTQIFNDALAAHINGIYTLSIPVLLAQYEGVNREFVFNYLKVKTKQNHKSLKENVLEKTIEGHMVNISELAMAKTLLEEIDNFIWNSFTFDTEVGRKTIKARRISRHSILL